MIVEILIFITIIFMLVTIITPAIKSTFLKVVWLGIIVAVIIFIIDYNLSYQVTKLKIEFKSELYVAEAKYNVDRIMEFLKTPKKRSSKFVPGERWGNNKKNYYEDVYTSHYWEYKNKEIIIYLSQSPSYSIRHNFISNFSTRFLEKHENIEVDREDLLKHIANKFETSIKNGNEEAKYKLEEVYDLLDELENIKLYFKDDPKFDKFVVQKSFLLNFYGKPKSVTFSSEWFSPFYNFNVKKY